MSDARSTSPSANNTRAHSDLLPCPFCGGKPIIQERGHSMPREQTYQVQCGECYCGTSNRYETATYAWIAWNKRATTGEAVAISAAAEILWRSARYFRSDEARKNGIPRKFGNAIAAAMDDARAEVRSLSGSDREAALKSSPTGERDAGEEDLEAELERVREELVDAATMANDAEAYKRRAEAAVSELAEARRMLAPTGFTKAQAEKFIADAHSEMGPTCEEEWVTAVGEFLLRPFTTLSGSDREAHLKS